MKRLTLAAVLVMALVSGCADQGGPCASPATTELKTVDRLIAETRANISRGYIERRTSSGMNFCLGGGGDGVGVSFCNDLGSRSQAIPVDRASEQRKLDALLKRRADLERQAALDASVCQPGRS